MLYKESVVSALCKHFSVLYMKAELNQMLCGMVETLGSLDLIRSEPTVRRPLFIYSEKPPLSADDMFDIFTIHYSASGSNDRERGSSKQAVAQLP